MASLKSDSNGLDERMYTALKAQRYSQIRYRLLEARLAEQTAEAMNQYKIRTKGVLSVAGRSEVITLPLTVRLDDATQTAKVSGEAELKMTSFGIDPPAILLGAVKAGDRVKVPFTWSLRRQPAAPEGSRHHPERTSEERADTRISIERASTR